MNIETGRDREFVGYTVKDCDCQYCLNYDANSKGYRFLVCAYIEERLQAGCKIPMLELTILHLKKLQRKGARSHGS